MSKHKTGKQKNQNTKPVVATKTITKKKFSNGQFFLIAALIGILAFTLYIPTGSFGLIEYDDQEYIKNNDLVLSGLTPQGIAEAMSAIVACNWHPLTLLSHMADISLFGNNPGSFHIVNALFHAANSILLFMLLVAGTGAFWRSCFVAIIFAVHPLNVESVAWVSERKNVLSTFFWFAGMLGYIHFVKRNNWRWYAFSIGCCIIGLLAKPMLVAFPVTILLLDFWPLERLKNLNKNILRKIIIEKIPFFTLSLAFCIITVIVQKQAGAMGGAENGFPLPVRIANAFISIGQYLLATLIPFGLSVFYPHPGLSISYGVATVWGIIIVGISALVYWKKYPFLIFGWSWFLVTLLPVLGIVQVGIQSHADRYMYVPMIGLLIMILWTGEQFFRKSTEAKRIGAGICIAAIIILSIVAENQISLWKTNFTLFSHAGEVTSRNQIAENMMGIEYGKQGNLREAERHLNAAIAINNNYDRAIFNLSMVRRMQGNIPAAIELCEKAISITPKFADVYSDLGILYFQNGMNEKAESTLLKAIELRPKKSIPYSNLGLIYFKEQRFADAEKKFRQALILDPHDETALANIGSIPSVKN